MAWGPAHTDALTLACVLLGKLTQALSLFCHLYDGISNRTYAGLL